MELVKYPDNTSYWKAETDLDWLENGVGSYVFPINSYEDLWHLNQWVDAWNSVNCCGPVWITIPNLPDAQADQRFNSNETFGLKLVIEFLAKMNARFEIFHPHNPEVVKMGFELLGNPVAIMDNTDFIKDVIVQLGGEFNLETGILMSSDAGGFKPLVKLADKLEWGGEIYSASKGRTFKDGESKLTQIVDRDDFDGKDVLIVDDLCIYGGTFKGLSKLLRARNVGKLYLAVSHMTIENLGNDPVTNYYDHVFTTNSKYDEYFYNMVHEKGAKAGTWKEKPKNLTVFNYFKK